MLQVLTNGTWVCEFPQPLLASLTHALHLPDLCWHLSWCPACSPQTQTSAALLSKSFPGPSVTPAESLPEKLPNTVLSFLGQGASPTHHLFLYCLQAKDECEIFK